MLYKHALRLYPRRPSDLISARQEQVTKLFLMWSTRSANSRHENYRRGAAPMLIPVITAEDDRSLIITGEFLEKKASYSDC